jgi:hypothetical protein
VDEEEQILNQKNALTVQLEKVNFGSKTAFLDRKHYHFVTSYQVFFNEILLPTYQTTWCHMSEDHNLGPDHCKNIKSQITLACFHVDR